MIAIMSVSVENHFLVRALAPSRDLIRVKLTAGEHAFRQGDPVHSIFVVETGRIRLDRCLADGAVVSLFSAGVGETFAEAALSADHYHCDAIAAGPSVVVALPVAELRAHFRSDATAAMDLAMFFARQVRDARARLELRNVRPASQRIIAWLRAQYTGSSPQITLATTWSDVAGELGLTREALYRALARLERDGLILRSSGRVTLTRRFAAL